MHLTFTSHEFYTFTEHKPWKWGATARYYASLTKTMLPTRIPQDITHLLQRPCYQQGSPCQDPAGNRTTGRPPDHRKEMQTAVVWSCLLFIRSGKNHLARHCESGKKTRQTEEELGRQYQGMDRPGVRQVQEGCGELVKWRKPVAKSSVVPQRPSWLRDRSDDDRY